MDAHLRAVPPVRMVLIMAAVAHVADGPASPRLNANRHSSAHEFGLPATNEIFHAVSRKARNSGGTRSDGPSFSPTLPHAFQERDNLGQQVAVHRILQQCFKAMANSRDDDQPVRDAGAIERLGHPH